MESSPRSEPANVTGGATAPSLDVFTRRSSGLVRQLSLFDVAWYGILAAAALFGLLYVFPGPQVFLPGVSVPLTSIIAIVLMFPVFALYAALGSSMPRAGGDYLYQSRSVHPALGFGITFGWEVFMWVTFTTTGGLVVATMGLSPLLYHLGLAWDSQALLDAGTWFGSDDGILITTLALVILAFSTTVSGMGTYRNVQRWILVPTIIISNLVLLILLLSSTDSFISAFNSFHEKALGESNYFEQVQQAAAAAGYEVPGFSLRNTLLFLSVAGIMWYVVFAAQGLLGEAKQANNFSRLFRAFLFGGLYVGIFAWLLPTFLFEQMVGRDFMYQYAFAFDAGEVATPVGATIPGFAMMLTDNPIVLILLSLGFITVGYYFATCVFLNMTRVMTAMGMDGSLPSWFSKVDQRWHAPINAAIFYFILAIGINLLFRFNDSVEQTMVFGGAFTSVGVVAVTGLAGVLFAYRAKHIYEASPASKYRMFGLPIVTLAGAITFLAAGAVTLMNLIVPELGFTTTASRLLLLLSVVVAIVWFFLFRAYQRQRGVDIDLAFKQVPPE